jgi:putative membrane protein
MLWVKSFHIVFVAMVEPDSLKERARLLLMARKLLRFSHMLAAVALLMGVWLWAGYGIGWGQGNAWMHAKLALVLAVVAYHAVCARMLRRFEAGEVQHGHVWFRWFNELPVLLMMAIVILVVVKPF